LKIEEPITNNQSPRTRHPSPLPTASRQLTTAKHQVANQLTGDERRFIDVWHSAGRRLQQIRDNKLRNLTEAEGTRLATFLGIEVETMPTASGLVEFQRYMKKWRQQCYCSTGIQARPQPDPARIIALG